jgi:hypothetical protein
MPRTFSIKTGLISAAFALLSAPAFAAELTYDTVWYQPPTAGATRIPRSTGAAAFLNAGSVQAGDISGAPFEVTLSAPSTMSNGKYALVAATISGGLEGTTVAYPPLPTYVPVWVGSSDIVVTYTYLPVGGGCASSPCPPGGAAIIDEASDSGGLLDDEFVEVYAPQTANAPDPGLTHTGNYLGVVDTTNQAVKIEADVNPLNPSNMQPTGATFDRWVSGQAAAFAPGDRDVDLAKLQSGYFLAYYGGACPSNYHFVSQPTLSECVPNNCAANQNWDSATNACVSCATDQYWNAATNKCVTVKNTCPPQCGVYGCIVVPPGVPPNNKPGDSTPIYACKNSKGGVGQITP